MQESHDFRIAYKIRYKNDHSDSGLANWSPLRQLNSWARSSDTYTLRAFLMAFGWKPFIVAAPRAHHFLSLDEATSAIEQIIMESSLLAYYSVSPHLSLADLFMLSVQGSHEPSEELRAGITAELEICDVPLTDHEFQLASLKDDNAKSEWFVVHHNGEEGHLFLVGDQDNVSWVPESRRGSCWSSADEMAALSMAKTVTRREGYYAYPLRFPKVAGN